MILQKLNLINFRSYSELSVSFPPEGALLEGLNGVGKTNLLEAIHILCTGRSQRGASRADMIAHGQDSAFVEGEFCAADNRATARVAPTVVSSIPYDNHTANADTVGAGLAPALPVTASLGFSRDKRVVMKRGGVEAGSFSEWFGERPVVSFGTDDLELVYGAPETRRKFLDMLICQMDRGYLDALASYRRNMACRNALLGKTDDSAQFEVYEQAMARHGATLAFRRAEAVNELRGLMGDFYAEISNRREETGMEFISKFKHNFNDIEEWRNVYLNSLAEYRKRDAELMFTASGPHRDDLRFLLDGRPAKSYASQGQCRSFALSLKLGSVLLLERHKQDSMIFLIDDAVSELDPERTSRVYPLLEGRGQIFIATPRCQAALGGQVMRCTVEPGRITVS